MIADHLSNRTCFLEYPFIGGYSSCWIAFGQPLCNFPAERWPPLNHPVAFLALPNTLEMCIQFRVLLVLPKMHSDHLLSEPQWGIQAAGTWVFSELSIKEHSKELNRAGWLHARHPILIDAILLLCNQ
jgi:hypothetical protein